jgi:hypothetical protein
VLSKSDEANEEEEDDDEGVNYGEADASGKESKNISFSKRDEVKKV